MNLKMASLIIKNLRKSRFGGAMREFVRGILSLTLRRCGPTGRDGPWVGAPGISPRSEGAPLNRRTTNSRLALG